MAAPVAHSRRNGGFTLLELSIVIFLIMIISAIALPQLLPAISFSQLEGQSRHLANYGRSVIAQATMLREDLTVYFDLDRQEYYTVRLEYPENSEGEGASVDQMAVLQEMRNGGMTPDMMSGMLSEGRMGGAKLSGMPEEYDDEAANKQMDDKFSKFARKALEERAKNVKQEASLMDEIGPLFDEKDKFSLEAVEPTPVELTDPVLGRTRIGEGARLERVVIEGTGYAKGLVQLNLSALGLTEKVWFYVVNDDGECYTVVWDPVTGGAHLLPGRQDVA